MSHLESGSVVWVRLGQAWWPGTITTVAKCPPEFVEGIRKIPIAIVKFFHENEFQDVHKAEHICPYNCDRKEEFIRRGQYTNKNQSHGEVDLLAKFEADVVTAEKLTGGDMNILQTLGEVAGKRRIDYSDLGFGAPKPKKRKEEGIKRGSDIGQAVVYKKVGNRNIGNKLQRVVIEHKVRILEQPKRKNVEEDMRGAANWYKCYSCGFTCSRLNVIIWHNKAHIKKVYNYDTGIKIPGRRKRKQGTPKSNKDIKKKAREAKSKENMQHAHTNGEVISSKKDVEDTQQLLKDWDDDDEGIDGETFTSLPRGLDKEKKRSDSDDGYSDTDDYPPLPPKYERRPMPKAAELDSAFDALLAATPANPITPSSSQTSNYVNNDSDSDYSDWEKYYARDSGSGSEDEEVEQESDIKSLCEGKEGKAETSNDTNTHMKQEEKDDDEGHSVQEDCLYEARQEDCIENTPSPKIDLAENINSDSLSEINREELTSESKEDGEEVSFQNAYYEPEENIVESVDIVDSVRSVDEPSETISEPAEDTDKPAEESNELAEDTEKTTEDFGEPVEDNYETAELIGEPTELNGEPPELIGEPPELIGEPPEPIGEPPEPSDEHSRVSDESTEDNGEHNDFIDNPAKDFEESDDCTDNIDDHLQEPEDISESSSHFDKPNVEMNESVRDIDELTQNIDRLNQNISEFTQSVSAKLGGDEEETKNIHETLKRRGSTHELTDRTFEATSISLPSHSKAESASEDGCESLKTNDAAATSSSDACSPSYNIQSSPTNPRLELDYTLMSHKLVASSDSLCSTCVANDDYLPRPQRNLWPEIGEGVSEGHEAHTQGDSDSYKVRNPHSNDKDQSSYQTTHDQITSQLNEQNMAFFNDHILGATDVEVSELQFKNSQSDSQLQTPRGERQCCFVNNQRDSILEYVIQKNYDKENEEKDNDLKQCIFDEKSNVDMHVNKENPVQFDTVKDHGVNIPNNKQKQKQSLRYDSVKMNINDNALECGQIQHVDKQAGQLHNDENFSTEAQGQELCCTSEVEEVKTLDEGDSVREVKDRKQIHTTKEMNTCFMVLKQQNSHCDKPLQVQLGNPDPQIDDHLRCKKHMEEKFPSSVHVLEHPKTNTEVLRHSHSISEQNCHQTQKQYGLLHEQQGSATLEQQHNISQEHSQSQTQKLFTNTAIQPEKCQEQFGTMYVANVEINMLTGSDNSKCIVKDLHNAQLTHSNPAGIDHNEHQPDATSSILSAETSHFVDEVHSELMIESSSTTASLVPRQSTVTKDLGRIPKDQITYSPNEDTCEFFNRSSRSNYTLVNAPSVSVTSIKETNSTNADGVATDFEGFEAEKNENIYALTKILVDIINNKKRLDTKKSTMKKTRQKKTKSPVGKFGRNKRIKVKKGKVGRKNTNIPVVKSERKKTKGAKRKLGRKNINCTVNDDSVVESKPSFIEKKNDSRLVKNIKNTQSTLKIGHAKVKRNFRCQLDSKNLPDSCTKKNTSNGTQTNIKTRSSRKVTTDSKQLGSSRHPARKRKSSEMDSVLKRENKIIRKELSPHELDISREKKQKKQVKVRKPGMHPKKKVTSRRGKNKNRNLDIRGGSTKEKEVESHSKEHFGLSDRLEMEDDLPDLTVVPLTKGKLGSRFKTGDLVWSLYRGKWWPSFIQKICPVTKKALVYYIGCKEGSGIRVDIKNMKTFRCGEMPSGVNQSENGFTEALQLTESYCQLRDHGKSISVQEFFSMPPEEQDALIIVTLTPKEDPSFSNQSMKRKLDEDMKEERTPESQKNWYYEPVRASGYGESSPKSNKELMLSARDRMKIQSAMKARRKENERLLRFMKSASCMDHLWQIFNGEKSCDRHKMYQDEVTRRTLLWSGIGPFQLDQDDDQILSVIDFLSTELSRKRPHFRLAHDYIFRVWMPEAIKEAMRVIKKVPEDELELALDEGYRETKSEKRARHLDFT